MLAEHVITDEALEYIKTGLAANRHWLAYNNISHFLEKADVYLFSDKEEAQEFSGNNISEYDDYSVVPLDTIDDIRKNITDKERCLIDHFEQNQFIHSNKTKVMNQKNFEYLDKQILYTGFGEGHSEKLKEKMMEGKPEFILTHQQDFGKDNTVATMQFRKSNDGDMYFLNSYKLLLQNAQHKDPIMQTFYINNDMRKKEQENITLKEGYNLLSGRAVNTNRVNKEGNAYNAWVQLDFKATNKHGNYEEKTYSQNYGYDLEKTLMKHPIKELADTDSKKQLMESLQRGNRQSVTFGHEGKEHKIFIEAAPRYKENGLNFYDSSMKRLTAQTLLEPRGEAQSEKKQEAKKETVKMDDVSGEADDGGKPQRNSTRRKNQGQSIS